MICFLLNNKLFCQTIFVYDRDDNNALPFAQIQVCDINKNNCNEYLANERGEIKIKIKENFTLPFIIRAFYYGYENFTDTIKSVFEDYRVYLKRLSYNLEEVIITGEITNTSKRNTLHRVEVISSDKIEKMGAQNVRDVLTNSNLFRMQQDPVLGSNLNFMGLSGQSVKILIDGVPVIGRLNGNIDLSQINTNNVERIEIIQGPMAVKYGTDATGGVINIITKSSGKKPFSINSNVYYESNGTYNTNFQLQKKFNKYEFILLGGRNYFDGWNINEKPFYIEKEKIADSTRYKLWKPKEQYFITMNNNIYIKKLKVTFNADFFDEEIEDKGKPRSPYFETAIDNYYKTRRDNQRLFIHGALNSKKTLDFILARSNYRRLKNAYFNDLTTLNKILTPNSSDHDTSNYESVMSRGSLQVKFKNYSIELGYDVSNEKAYSSIIEKRTQSIQDYAAFIISRIQYSKNDLKPSLRLGFNSKYGMYFIPSFHYKYILSNKFNDISLTSLYILTSYSRGFRSPSIKELYLNFIDINHNIVGNKNLSPETSDYIDLSVNYSKYKKSNFEMSLIFFSNYVKNLIRLASDNGLQYTYLNIDKIHIIGNGFNIKWNSSKIQLNTNINYTGINYLYPKSEFYFYPEYSGSLSYLFQKTALNLFVKYNGSIPYYVKNNESDYKIIFASAFTQIDITVSQKFFNEKIIFTSGIKNILNVTNLNMAIGGVHSSGNSVLISNGRTYFFQLNLKL